MPRFAKYTREGKVWMGLCILFASVMFFTVLFCVSCLIFKKPILYTQAFPVILIDAPFFIAALVGFWMREEHCLKGDVPEEDSEGIVFQVYNGGGKGYGKDAKREFRVIEGKGK